MKRENWQRLTLETWTNENGEKSMHELTMTHLRKRRPPKTETLAFKVFKTLPKSGQSVQNTLKSVSRNQNQKNPKESEENGVEKRAWEPLNIPNPNKLANRSSYGRSPSQRGQCFLLSNFCTIFHFVILHLPFSVEIPNF